MMLPEHVNMLREYSGEVKRDPRPDLNEWDLEAITVAFPSDTFISLFQSCGQL